MKKIDLFGPARFRLCTSKSGHNVSWRMERDHLKLPLRLQSRNMELLLDNLCSTPNWWWTNTSCDGAKPLCPFVIKKLLFFLLMLREIAPHKVSDLHYWHILFLGHSPFVMDMLLVRKTGSRGKEIFSYLDYAMRRTVCAPHIFPVLCPLQ